ncbi:helix-turn-helix transcriptional regulator [Mesorhizobium sp. M0213]|uniref:helix-turn-helix transcriptional regulator n=1 Tax=Mesorhizobium sp. M0213 TaxID=2956917 RepID=UPI0033375C87
MLGIVDVSGPPLAITLGETARAVGSAAFHDRLLRLLAMLLDWDRRIAIGYFDGVSPEFFFSEGVPDDCRDLYLSSYYQFDPFLRYWAGSRQCGVVTLHDVASLDYDGTFIKVFNPMIGISDEVGILLPWFCGSTLGLFLERTHGQYSVESIRLLRNLYPLILGLQEAHLSCIGKTLEVKAAMAGASHGSQAVLIIGARGERLFSSTGWDRAEIDLPGLASNPVASLNGNHTSLCIDDRHTLAIQPLQLGLPALDDGWIYILREAPVRTDGPDIDGRVNSFRMSELTPRESEVVKLILAGYPTVVIAKRLGISRGTVKNHRNCIYEKLDITTERELFLLLLEHLGSHTRTRDS